jgi:hypothetical protein
MELQLLLHLCGPWTKTTKRKAKEEWQIWEAAMTRSPLRLPVAVAKVVAGEWALKHQLLLDHRVSPLLSALDPPLPVAVLKLARAAVTIAALAAAHLAAAAVRVPG